MKELLKDIVAGLGVVSVILLVVCKCLPWVGRFLLRDPHADAAEAVIVSLIAIMGAFVAGVVIVVLGACVRGRA